MGEYIKDQTLATTIQAGDYLVFDTATGTFKITRQNLLGQMDTNTNAIAVNVTDIATNETDIATNETDIATNTAAIATINSNLLQLAKITLTTGELSDLANTPIVVIPESPGTYIQLIDITGVFVHDGVAFTDVGDLQFEVNGNRVATMDKDVYSSGANKTAKASQTVSAFDLATGDMTVSLTSNPAAGNGTLILSAIYKRIS